MDSKIDLIERALLSKCFEMVVKQNVCPKTPRSEMMQILEYCHDKGWLYTNPKANAFVCCYKIPKVDEKYDKEFPKEETGEILYVNFAVSDGEEPSSLLKILRGYLLVNPEVKEMVYYRRGSDTDFKHIYLRRNENGK